MVRGDPEVSKPIIQQSPSLQAGSFQTTLAGAEFQVYEVDGNELLVGMGMRQDNPMDSRETQYVKAKDLRELAVLFVAMADVLDDQ
jgi:hypothetical protein